MRALTKLATVVAAAALVAAGGAQALAAAPSATTDVRLITFNDFHGNLQPPAGSSGRVTLPDGTTVDAGGAAYLATHVKQLRGEVANSLVLSAGDNVGASPLDSALFHDEPTMELLNGLGVKASTIGNHELDEGYRELLRMQFGGCHPTDGCQFRDSYSGAQFPILGGERLLRQRTARRVPLHRPVLRRRADRHHRRHAEGPAAGGHPGGDRGPRSSATRSRPSTGPPSCSTASASRPRSCSCTRATTPRAAARTTARPSPARRPRSPRPRPPRSTSCFTGHSHQQYNCTVSDPAGNPRTLIQGASFGRLLSVVDLKIDKRSRDVVRDKTLAHNEIVTRTVTPDPTVQALVDEAKTKAAPIANEQVGTITADLVRAAPASGESPLGDVIADAQLAATAANNAADRASPTRAASAPTSRSPARLPGRATAS